MKFHKPTGLSGTGGDARKPLGKTSHYWIHLNNPFPGSSAFKPWRFFFCGQEILPPFK